MCWEFPSFKYGEQNVSILSVLRSFRYDTILVKIALVSGTQIKDFVADSLRSVGFPAGRAQPSIDFCKIEIPIFEVSFDMLIPVYSAIARAHVSEQSKCFLIFLSATAIRYK